MPALSKHRNLVLFLYLDLLDCAGVVDTIEINTDIVRTDIDRRINGTKRKRLALSVRVRFLLYQASKFPKPIAVRMRQYLPESGGSFHKNIGNMVKRCSIPPEPLNEPGFDDMS